MSPYAPDVRIKWPNDLVVGRAKLAGVLLEREAGAVVAGFGVNLARHPEDIDRPATSVAALAGTAPDPADFLDALAAAFAAWLGRWRRDGVTPLRSAWLAAAHPPGTPLATHGPDGRLVAGGFDGLDESGSLRLRLADGRTHVIHAGDVFLA